MGHESRKFDLGGLSIDQFNGSDGDKKSSSCFVLIYLCLNTILLEILVFFLEYDW